MNFTKMHGAGNDYVVIDARDVNLDWSRIAVALCDRHMGVGADGIILALNSTKANLRMRMLNPDGSEAEMCGNGIRCLTKFAVEHSIVSMETTEITVETLSGIKSVNPLRHGHFVDRARVNMGPPQLQAELIPVSVPQLNPTDQIINFPLHIDDQQLYITCVSMGNPHAVAFTDTPVQEFPLSKIGPLMENHPIFPNKVNFSIANIVDKCKVSARVWERGAGETMACGTGACAIAVAARANDMECPELLITLPGGDLRISWDGNGPVYMEGPVTQVYTGTWPD